MRGSGTADGPFPSDSWDLTMSSTSKNKNNQLSLATATPPATLPRDCQPDDDLRTRNMTMRPDTNGRRLPTYMDPTNDFGELTFLQLIGKDDSPLPKNPFMIGRSVEEVAGGQIEDAASEAQGTKYLLKVRNPTQVQKLLKMRTLLDGTEVIVQPHPNLNVSRCVISCYDLIQLEEREIIIGLIDQGVIYVKRIQRNENGSKVNTPALILTFAKATYPEYVKIGLLRVRTRPYYPNPLLCYGCYRFGHPRARCPGPQRCYKCSGLHQVDTCNENDYCLNCKEAHRPSSRQCTVYKSEMEIVKIKIQENVTYPEARKRAAQRESGSYANAVSQQNPEQIKIKTLENILNKRDEQIKELLETAKKREKDIELLQTQIEQLSQHIQNLQPSVKLVSCKVNNNKNIQRQNTGSRDSSPTKEKKKRGRPKRSSTKNTTTAQETKSPPRKKAVKHTTEDSSSDSDIEIAETPPNQHLR